MSDGTNVLRQTSGLALGVASQELAVLAFHGTAPDGWARFPSLSSSEAEITGGFPVDIIRMRALSAR